MREKDDDAIKTFRQSIGHVPNYFPHHRYGAYFVQAKVGNEVVFRQHFDAFGEKAARDFSQALSQIDARQTPNLWKYTAQYVKDMLRNSDRVDRLTGNIKAVAFTWYLGGSIKTAFVNATQNLAVGVPRLQMDVSGGALMWLKGAQDALVDRVTGNKGRGLKGDEARLIEGLYGESVITDAFMEEVRGQLRGVSGASLNKFTRVLGLPMSEAERFNRASLALAAFRAARSEKLKARAREKYGGKGKADYEQAKAFAADVVRDAHFVYGKGNMPEFMRSNIAGRAMSSMYTFRMFTHNMVAMWSWTLRTQGREGAAFVAKSLGGVTALPLYATLMALCQIATGNDDDWTELIRKHLPESNLLRDVVCLGFQPVSSTKSYEAYAASKHADQVRSDKIDELTVLTLRTYDTATRQGGGRPYARLPGGMKR